MPKRPAGPAIDRAPRAVLPPIPRRKTAVQKLARPVEENLREAADKLRVRVETPFTPSPDPNEEIARLRKERVEAGKAFGTVTKDELDAIVADNRRGKTGKLVVEEKLVILELYAGGIPASTIARHLCRPQTTIDHFLRIYRSSVPMARLHFEANAEKLAQRIVDRADVNQALEVMDRMGVLEKKRDKESHAESRFQVVVGVVNTSGDAPKGIPAIPIPTQAQIQSAKMQSAKVIDIPKEPSDASGTV